MRCCVCKRNIAAGVEAQKMIVEYRQPDGTSKIFGYMMSDGPLTTATGQLLRGWHHKCYHIVRKREGRGDAVTGRVLHGIPTGYDIGSLVLTREEFEALGISEEEARQRGTAYLTARLDRLRNTSRRIGKGIGDATVLEAFWAEEHGGPYDHHHHLRLETYQLLAHLRYAHGWEEAFGRQGIRALHDELHARLVLTETQAQRDSDPGHAPSEERDWREQVAVDVTDLQ